MELTMVLDREQLGKVLTYYVYRSAEMVDDSPLADGLYLQRGLFDDPPDNIRIEMSWE